MKIEKIHAREILDSRGNPTVEVEVKAKGKIEEKIKVLIIIWQECFLINMEFILI